MKKCVFLNSEEYYAEFLYKSGGSYNEIHDISNLCSNDKSNYQSCGLGYENHYEKIGEYEIPCELIFCQIGTINLYVGSAMYSLYHACEIYDIDLSCNKWLHLNLNKSFCELQPVSSGHIGGVSEIMTKPCDMICDDNESCFDEAICNGFQYGMFCNWWGKMLYIKTDMVCDNISHCDDSSDEKNCFPEGEDSYCSRIFNNRVKNVTLFNYTRCGPLTSTRGVNSSLCPEFYDQYNCSDPSRGLLRCEKNSFPSTVSWGVLCKYRFPPLCDDGIDMKCQQSSNICLLHKHLLCDNTADCQDGSDENTTECWNLHSDKCYRR